MQNDGSDGSEVVRSSRNKRAENMVRGFAIFLRSPFMTHIVGDSLPFLGLKDAQGCWVAAPEVLSEGEKTRGSKVQGKEKVISGSTPGLRTEESGTKRPSTIVARLQSILISET